MPCFGLFEDCNIGVGIFPELEEVLERFFRSRCVARKRVTARHSQVGPNCFSFADHSALDCASILFCGPCAYFCSRIHGVKVIPTSIPSGEMKRLTICPQGSFLFFTSIRYPPDSRTAVAFSTLSTSNSSQAWGAGMSLGQESLPKQDWAA